MSPTLDQCSPNHISEWFRAVIFSAALGLALGCSSPPPPAGTGTALLDGTYAPDLLIEQRELALPPATGGNRFVAGWWPWRVAGQPVLTPLPVGGRLELVTLEPRARNLVLDLFDESPPATGRVLVRVDGQQLGRFEIRDPLEIELPAEVEPGRVLVEIVPEDELVLKVTSAGLRNVLPAGEVELEGRDFSQQGRSALDFAFEMPGQARLSGAFEPPSSPEDGQEYLLEIQRQGRWEILFHWRGTWWDRLRGSRQLDLPLTTEDEVVRLRFEAIGQGPPALWRGLTIDSPPPPATRQQATQAEDRSSPPELVLVYVMDALRADHLGRPIEGGVDGSSASMTPHLDRLANEGMVFSGHRSVAPNTLPSTKALFIGQTFLQGGGEKLPAEGRPTVAEVYQRAGYATAMFSNNPYISATFGVDRGFDHVEAPPAEPAIDYHHDAAVIHRSARQWLATVEPGTPVFLYLHVLHPHNPYEPPADLAGRFTAGIDSDIDGSTETLIDVQRFRRQADGDDQRRLAGLYAAALAYNDREIGQLLDALGQRFAPADSWIAMTADHGEELFDHGGVLHGWTLYEEMIRIPLVLWAPGRIEPGRQSVATSTLDLHATLLALAQDRETASDGRPLPGVGLETDFEKAEGIHLASAASVGGGIFSAQSERYKLILAPRSERRWGMGEALGRSRDAEYLFDLEADPAEEHNLAGLDQPEVAWLRSRLLAWIDAKRAAAAGAEAVRAEATVIDEETRRRLEALGYVD